VIKALYRKLFRRHTSLTICNRAIAKGEYRIDINYVVRTRHIVDARLWRCTPDGNTLIAYTDNVAVLYKWIEVVA
jgi:hypothetical protein